MLMNENSELRSLLRLSKNFSKNIINKSIKNNIVLINNDGGVKTKRKHRGFTPSTFGVIVTCIKFSLYIKKLILTYTLFKIFITSLIIIKTLIFFSSLFASSISSSLTALYAFYSKSPIVAYKH